MADLELRRRAYATSIDRAGLAIMAGGLILGLVEAALVVAGGRGLIGALMGFVFGGLLSMLAITAVAVPLWLALHLAGRRGPFDAALAGGLLGFLMFLAAQTSGMGLFYADEPGVAYYRWASAAALSLAVAVIAALVALVMWRVAYRREG